MAAQNQRLQQHLQETTSSFREALQLVESLMGGVALWLLSHVLRGQAVKCSACSLLVMCSYIMHGWCRAILGLFQFCWSLRSLMHFLAPIGES